jgi:Helix-turn-helix domain
MSGRKSLPAVWRDAIRESELDPTARHVAHVLSTWMNGRGVCWPGRETIAEGTGYSVRTVERAVARLERDDWLRVERGVGQRSNRYFALLPVVASESRHQEWPIPTNAVCSGDSDDRSGDTGAARKRLKRESGGSTASALSGASAEPLGDCEVCGETRALVDPDAHYCAECFAQRVATAKEAT